MTWWQRPGLPSGDPMQQGNELRPTVGGPGEGRPSTPGRGDAAPSAATARRPLLGSAMFAGAVALSVALSGLGLAARRLVGRRGDGGDSPPERRILEALGPGVWAVDAQGRTTFLNPAMAAMLGSEPGRLRGRRRDDMLGATPAGGGRVDVLLRRDDGAEAAAVVEVRPIRDAGGRALGSVAVVEPAPAPDEMVEALGFPAWVVDAQSGALLAANEAAVARYGYARDEFRAMTLRDLDPEPGPGREAAPTGQDGPSRHRARDGSTLEVEVRSSEIARPGRPIRLVQAVDVSAYRRAEAEARASADRAGRSRDDFIAALSHELRTPLTPVLVQISALLGDPQTPPAIRPTLELTCRNIELEARLIDDLLDVTELRRGSLRLRREVVDVHALVAEAVEIARDELSGRGHRLALDLAARSHHAEADPTRLRQVVWNLLRNAAKYTPEGGSLTVRSRDGGPDGRTLVLEVADTGVGIAAGDLERIFGAFEQGDRDRRRFGGLGLGLAISRALAVAHGGSLVARSDGPGLGSTFVLRVPSRPAPAPSAAPRPPAPAPTPAGFDARLTLLLVEDNVDTLRVMDRLLRLQGFRVLTAMTVASAVELGLTHDVDFLVSDIGLPDGSGLDVMRKIRAKRPLPGIAVSGFATEDDRNRSLDAGFAAHLAKPLDFGTLADTIRRHASVRAAG